MTNRLEFFFSGEGSNVRITHNSQYRPKWVAIPVTMHKHGTPSPNSGWLIFVGGRSLNTKSRYGDRFANRGDRCPLLFSDSSNRYSLLTFTNGTNPDDTDSVPVLRSLTYRNDGLCCFYDYVSIFRTVRFVSGSLVHIERIAMSTPERLALFELMLKEQSGVRVGQNYRQDFLFLRVCFHAIKEELKLQRYHSWPVYNGPVAKLPSYYEDLDFGQITLKPIRKRDAIPIGIPKFMSLADSQRGIRLPLGSAFVFKRTSTNK
jgi:hypothetical protein